MPYLIGVAAILTPVAVIVGHLLTRVRTAAIEAKTDEIHVLVNNRMTEALNRIGELERKLGIAPGAPVTEGEQ